MSTTAPHLPPLQEDPTLARLLPPHLDHREFRRVPHNPDRYAASLLGAGVWDLHQNRFVVPQPDGEGRHRVRINPGPNNAKPRLIYYSIILALIVLGPPLHPKDEAHHKNGNPHDNHWSNVFWQSPPQNRAMAAKHQAQKRRLGQSNGNAILTFEELTRFIRQHDEDWYSGRRIRWEAPAFCPDISERQLRRIANGQSRADEVAAIREKIAAENKKRKTN